MNTLTPATALADLTDEQRRAILADLTQDELAALEFTWSFWARPDQLPPRGDWRTWLLLGGRGSGKTRSSAEWVRGQIETGRRSRIALCGPTSDTIRRDMVEGPSGILAVFPNDDRPSYEPSTRRIVFLNGAVAYLFSAEEPDRLRGPNLDAAWCDELAAWADADGMWSNLQMSLRLTGPKGDAPQVLVSTTPRRHKLLRQIMDAPSTIVTRSRTTDNTANLDGATLAYLQQRYGGTTLGRQELDAELLDDVDGALWNRKMIEETRRAYAPKELRRIVVAIDPAGGTGKGSTETGIIVAGIGREDGHGYVLEDCSGKFTPQQWAKRAVDACVRHKADRIVCERNFGGDMVEANIRSVAPRAPIKMVQASRGKAVRAEPIVSHYEQGKCHHVGNFSALEDQLCGWDPNSNDPSPDRLDALVWALTDLFQPGGTTRVQRLAY
jgi:phage terminase large subunit-like protein